MYLIELSVQPRPSEELPSQRGARHRRAVQSEVNSRIVQIRADDLRKSKRGESHSTSQRIGANSLADERRGCASGAGGCSVN